MKGLFVEHDGPLSDTARYAMPQAAAATSSPGVITTGKAAYNINLPFLPFPFAFPTATLVSCALVSIFLYTLSGLKRRPKWESHTPRNRVLACLLRFVVLCLN